MNDFKFKKLDNIEKNIKKKRSYFSKGFSHKTFIVKVMILIPILVTTLGIIILNGGLNIFFILANIFYFIIFVLIGIIIYSFMHS